MKDYSSSSINWPVPDKPFGGTGSPVASSTNGDAWKSYTDDSYDTPEEVPNEGSEPSGEGCE